MRYQRAAGCITDVIQIKKYSANAYLQKQIS